MRRCETYTGLPKACCQLASTDANQYCSLYHHGSAVGPSVTVPFLLCSIVRRGGCHAENGVPIADWAHEQDCHALCFNRPHLLHQRLLCSVSVIISSYQTLGAHRKLWPCHKATKGTGVGGRRLVFINLLGCLWLYIASLEACPLPFVIPPCFPLQAVTRILSKSGAYDRKVAELPG